MLCGTQEAPGCTNICAHVACVVNLPALPCGKALYGYEGKEPGDLQFSKGDIIILRRKVDDNWYHGELNGCHGFLPASYIQLLRPLSQTPPYFHTINFPRQHRSTFHAFTSFAFPTLTTLLLTTDLQLTSHFHCSTPQGERFCTRS
ncbi:hypothetical protein CRUP_007142 [Coryphaenoides rupestris]|nr:hypothetical protein CRUP_007142 [Coryphaenoides rupestris]